MDENIGKVTQGLVDLIGANMSKNHIDTPRFATNITTVSLIHESKIGVMIGEVLESSLLEVLPSIDQYNLSREEKDDVLNNLTSLIGILGSAITTDSESDIYNALLEIRYYATKKQYEIPTKHERKHLTGSRRIIS